MVTLLERDSVRCPCTIIHSHCMVVNKYVVRNLLTEFISKSKLPHPMLSMEYYCMSYCKVSLCWNIFTQSNHCLRTRQHHGLLTPLPPDEPMSIGDVADHDQWSSMIVGEVVPK